MKCKRGIRKRPNYSVYWKNRIGYDYREEIKIYRYLCGKYMLKKPVKECCFTEKRRWEIYVQDKYKDCEKEKLVSFLDCLRQQKRYCEMESGINTNMLIPFIVGMISSDYILEIFKDIDDIIKEPSIAEGVRIIIGLILLYAVIIFISWLIIKGIKSFYDSENRKYFYEDYMVIISAITDEGKK